MPPKVREAKRLLRQRGFTVERPGKGDHTVFYNPTTKEQYTLDGADSKEMTYGRWAKLRKILRLE